MLRALEQAILRQDPDVVPTSGARGDPQPGAHGTAVPRRRLLLGLVATVAVPAGRCDFAAVAMTLGEADPGAKPRRSAATPSPSSTQRPRLSARYRSIATRAIAYGAGSIWVSLSRRSLRRTDLAVSRRVVASISLEAAAQDLAATGSGSGRSARALPIPPSRSSEIDPTFDTVARVRRLPMVVAGDSGSIAAERGHGRRRASRRVPDADRRSERADARPGSTRSRADCGRAGLRQLVARLPRGEPRRPRRRDPAPSHDPGRTWAVGGDGRPSAPSGSPMRSTGRSSRSIPRRLRDHDRQGRERTSAITHGDGSVWVANAGDGTLTRIDERTSRPTARSPSAAARRRSSRRTARSG